MWFSTHNTFNNNQMLVVAFEFNGTSYDYSFFGGPWGQNGWTALNIGNECDQSKHTISPSHFCVL